MANNNPFVNGPMPTQQNTTTVSDGEFMVDLNGVELNSYTIPDGAYRVVCTNVEQQVSKGGNPMFVWDFSIASGDYAGRNFKVFTAITPAAMWKVAETVIALGVGQAGEVVKFKRSDVINKECGAIIEQTEYDGKNRSQIQRVISLKELAEIG